MNREARNRQVRSAAGEVPSLEPVPDGGGASLRGDRPGRRTRGRREGLIAPILVGPAARIREVARQGGIDLGQPRIVDAPHSHAAAAKAVELVRQGRGRAPDERQPAHRRAPRRGGCARDRPAHRAPHQPRLHHGRARPTTRSLIVTDAAINIAPTLEDKVDICQNAIDLAVSLGVTTPEGRDPRRRRDGHLRRCRRRSTPRRCARWPIAARSPAACSTARWPSTTPSARRRPRSPRASGRRSPAIPTSCSPRPRGRQHPGQAAQLPRQRRQRRVVLGARVPIILTSRADSVRSRIASCAVAVLAAHTRRQALQQATSDWSRVNRRSSYAMRQMSNRPCAGDLRGNTD